MIEGLRPYDAYKDSGIPWLGRLPRHWSIWRSKRLFAARKELAQPEDVQLSATQAYGVIPQAEFERRVQRRVVRISMHLDKRRHVEKDDFVISMRSFQGGLERAWASGAIRSSYVVLKPGSEVVIPYFAYLFKSHGYIRALQSTSDFIRDGQDLNYGNFCQVDLPLPPPDEQAAIGRFLDHANRRIERFIRAKQKLIALLNEQKQAIIHRAVTRGLDPNVPLKDSGVPWLGQIPAHWEPLQARRLFSLVTSGSRGWAEYYSDDGDVFLQSGNLGRTMSLNLSRIQHVRLPGGAEGLRTRVQADDVLICITGALTGNVVIVDKSFSAPAYVNQHVALCRPRPATVPRFVAYCLHSNLGRVQFKAKEYGGTKQGLGLDDVKAAWIPHPPANEQRRICVHLDQATAELTDVVVRAEHEIALIREYRTRLISDVVTGQLDVREAASKLPPDEPAPEDTAPAADEDDDTEEGEAA